jgi:hypothetical protein
MSACSINGSGSAPCSGQIAIPTLVVMRTSSRSSTKGRASAARIFSASTLAPARLVEPGLDQG